MLAPLRRTLIAAATTTLLAVPSAASAYLCTAASNKGAPLTQAWNQRCIPYKIDRRGTLFGGDERRALIAQSFAVWSGNACTDLEFLDAGYTDAGAGFDATRPASNTNVIMVAEDPEDLVMFPGEGLLAITLTSYSTATGEILDADILMNAVDFTFDDVSDPRGCQLTRRAFDLRNTLIHEMGHFIGFDHPPETASTMFASAEPCETKKRDLSDDDRLGLCTVYPKGQPTKTCAEPPEGYDAGQNVSGFRCQCAEVTGLAVGECADLKTGCMCVAELPASVGEGASPGSPVGGDAALPSLGAVVFGLLVLRRARRAR